jgi:hypothetical protein
MDIKQLQALAGVNEASVNISLNGTNSQEIKDLMGIFQKDERAPLPPTGIAKPPMSMDMPGMDIDVAPPIGLGGPLPPLPPPKPMDSPLSLDKPMDLDSPSPCSTCGGIHSEEEQCGEGTEWDNAPKEKYNDADFMTKDIAGGINGPKNPKDIRVKDPSSMAEYKQYLMKKLQESYDEFQSEEQTFSGRSDRTYFIVPNDEDYMDIQDDSRFAGDIEVPDENADIMALPNSKFRKLKMMYGNKILDLGTDYDEAVEREEQKAKRRHLAGISRTKAGGSAGRRSEGMQSTREKELVGKQHKLPPHLKKKIEDAPEDQVNSSQYDEDMGDIRRLSGLGEAPKKKNSLAQQLRMKVGNKLGVERTLLSKGPRWSDHQLDQAFEFIAARPKMAEIFKRLDHPGQVATMEKVLKNLNKGQEVRTGGTAMNTTSQPQRDTTATLGDPNMMGGVA